MSIGKKLGTGVAAAMFIVWMLLFRPTFLGGGTGYIMVSGISMQPTLYTGDLVVTRKQETYEVGDVIAYLTEGGAVIHRVIGGNLDDGYVTQGDNRDFFDEWKPKPENIIGKRWFHVSGAGKWVQSARQPLPLGLLMGGVMTSTLVSKRKKVFGRRRRRTSQTAQRQPRGVMPGPGGYMVGLVIVSAVALGLLALTAYAIRQPLTSTHYDERLSYEHTADFSYIANTDHSTLYPDGVVGPVSAAAPDAALPLYTKLTHDINLDIAYHLQSDLPPIVDGEMNVLVTVSATDGWSQVVDTLEPIPFTDNGVESTVTIDVQRVQGLIEQIEKETGYSAPSYDVTVAPTISVQGQIGSEPVESVYTPSYVIGLSSAQVTPPVEFQQSEVKSIGEDVVEKNTLSLFGATTTVQSARQLGVIGLAVALMIAGLLAARVFLGLGGSETDKIRARYGSILIEVSDADFGPQWTAVDVASMPDLARLAQRDGRTIFHHAVSPTARRYFVTDTSSLYQYVVESPIGRI